MSALPPIADILAQKKRDRHNGRSLTRSSLSLAFRNNWGRQRGFALAVETAQSAQCSRRRTRRQNEVRTERHKLLGCLFKQRRIGSRPAGLELDILPVDPTELFQRFVKCGEPTLNFLLIPWCSSSASQRAAKLAGCCARAASGNAGQTEITLMKSRRRITLPKAQKLRRLNVCNYSRGLLSAK